MQFHSPSGLHEPLRAPLVEGEDGCVAGLEATDGCVAGFEATGDGDEAPWTKTPADDGATVGTVVDVEVGVVELESPPVEEPGPGPPTQAG